MNIKRTSIVALLCVGILGVAQAVAQSAPAPRVPERVCLAENYSSTASSCTLTRGIPAGDGVIVFGTASNTAGYNMGNALQDSEGNTYAQVETEQYVGNASGTIYMWYSRLTTALAVGDTITLSPLPSLDSWDFSVYDVGPVQTNPADVGVVFVNGNVGTSNITNPATGVPGWWTGQTAPTTGAQDMCMAGMTVNTTGGGNAPSPITSYSMDNHFLGLDVVDFHAQGAPTSTSPNYAGGSLMTMYAEVPSGTAVQSHVVTSQVPDSASSEMFCLKEAAGATTNVPYFTGNYCTGATGCTLNNVKAGDMLIISTHSLDGSPLPSPASVTDSLGETAVFDTGNVAADVNTWHISPVLHAGTHSITVNNFGTTGQLVNVFEIAGQASSGNPVEATGQGFLNSANLAVMNITTIDPNDLLYAWGRAESGSDEGDGFTSMQVAPTAEYAVAPGPGTYTATLLPRGTLPEGAAGVQGLAIRPAGTTQPASTTPHYTGNYCLASATTCTINNVQAGDMLIVSVYWGPGAANDKPTLTDSQGEVIVADRPNDFDGAESLGTWHIADVAHAGTHTLSMSGGTVQYAHMAVLEFSGQNPTNPLDVPPVAATGTGTQASTSIQTASGNDLIYVWCSGPEGSGTGDGFAAASLGPTAEYRAAAATPGTEAATCPINGTSNPWTIQEFALRGSVSGNAGSPLVSIAVTPANASIAQGETQQYTATGTFGNGSTQNLTGVAQWASGDSSVATISSGGMLSAVGEGSTTVQATSSAVSGSTNVTVSAVVLTSIAVTPTQSSVFPGKTQQFTATGTYSDGSTLNLSTTVAWSSTNTAVATVNSAGLATGVAGGSTTITATLSGFSSSAAFTVATGFPGTSYDMWVDFEQCPTGAAPTAACLASSTHGAAGSWDVSAMASLVSVQAAAADPGSSDGNNATRGLAYNVANGGVGYIQWIPPTQLSALSFGMWYKTGQPGAYVEGPHFITLFNATFGPMLRLSDERSSANNARGIRVSPLDVAVTGLADNTWYWVTMKWVQNGQGEFSVYDSSLNLVGGVDFTDPNNFPVQDIQLGNSSATAPEPGEADYMDDLIVDYTNVPFPVLPQKVIRPLVSITVTPANPSLAVGTTQQFIATGTYSDGTTQNLTGSVTWSSSNASAASITAGGLVSAIAAGATTLQATSGSITGSVNVTITPPALVSIAVTPTNPTLLTGSTEQFTATGTYTDGSTNNLTSSASWSSSNPGAATINASGVASGVGNGSTTIQATSGSVSGSTSLTVASVVLDSITVTPSNPTIAAGATEQFTATGIYSNGSRQNLTSTATWASSQAAVATINSSGLATGFGAGTATIQASVGGINGSTSLTVTASYPGVYYDTWIDFEQCPEGAAPTAACLTSSTHGTAGSWDVSAAANLLSVQAAGADPDRATDGSNATRGFAYNLANGGVGYAQWTPSTQLNALSFGFWYKTGQPAAWTEGPHIITLYNNAYGPMLRLADERSSGDNSRQIRVSPLDAAVTGIADNTWYWITMKWVQNGQGTLSVYDTSLNLVGSVNFTDPNNYPAQIIQLGNSSATPAEPGETVYFDDVIFDYTNVQFPILPTITATTAGNDPPPQCPWWWCGIFNYTNPVMGSLGLLHSSPTITNHTLTLARNSHRWAASSGK